MGDGIGDGRGDSSLDGFVALLLGAALSLSSQEKIVPRRLQLLPELLGELSSR